MDQISIREIAYKDYGKCIELANGRIDVLCTVDIGPRIIRFGFAGKENMFCECNEQSMPVPDGEWKIRGGHRLWHGPENVPRTYLSDNKPVEWKAIENGIILSQDVERASGMKKEMEVTMSPSCSKVKVLHRITNKGLWPVELSVWSITVVAAGGRQIMPMPHRETGVLPNRLVALWPYSRMNDHRVYWGDKYIVLDQNPNMQPAFKLGFPNEDGWAAYMNKGSMFIKRFRHVPGARYFDFGSSYETYTNDFIMEMESISPCGILSPDESMTHAEDWELVEFEGITSIDEDKIGYMVKKYIEL